MTQNQCTTESRTGKHLDQEERNIIQEKKRQGWSNRQVARFLGRAPQTIHNEIKRGTTIKRTRQSQNGKEYLYDTPLYFAQTGQAVYEQNRKNCGRPFKFNQCAAFIEFADSLMQADKPWSPDAVIMEAHRLGLFTKKDIPCTTTLYNWIDLGLMGTINLDLLLKTRRKTKLKQVRKNHTNLGISIEQRPQSVDLRQEFGHWEIDTVIGSRSGQGAVLVTLVERKTRYEIILKAERKTAEAMTRAIDELKSHMAGHFKSIFKTVTSDNGTEFSNLTESLLATTGVFFAHPYSSWERGTNENHNGLIRRFIPKGSDITPITKRTIQSIEQWMNRYPRKILKGATPLECFLKEVTALEGLIDIAI